MGIARNGRAETVIDRPVEAVWEVVADVTRTGEWSDECHDVRWLGNATAAAPGVRFRGRSRSGRLRWNRICEVVSVDPARELVWRTVPTVLFPDGTEWRIVLEPAGSGTRITEAYRVTKLPRPMDWLLTRINPAHIDRTAALTGDLQRLGVICGAGTEAARQPGG